MRLALGKEQSKLFEREEAAAALDGYREKQEFFLTTIQQLLHFLKDFSLNIKELNSEAFLKDLQELEAELSCGNRLNKARSSFRKHQKRIHRFVERQKRYLVEREKELKDIIDLLVEAMVTLDSDNRQYHLKIHAQSEKMERITRLDDIKKIKQALIYEIENIRQAIRDKQDQDMKQLRILSKKVSILNHELEKVKAESVTDGLTGIYNRKAFDRYFDELFQKSTAVKTSFSILMIDIDNFKAVNDAYGHQTGDRALMAMAHKCRSLIRHQDFIARYGGEEFIIVLTHTSLGAAVKKAHLICRTIAGTHYSLDEIQPGGILALTVSIGVSSYQNGDTARSLIDRADRALYTAKHSGKNRVESETN